MRTEPNLWLGVGENLATTFNINLMAQRLNKYNLDRELPGRSISCQTKIPCIYGPWLRDL